MAYIPIVGDILRVTIAATYPDSQVQENNIHFVVTGAGSTDPRANIGPDIYSMYLSRWLGRIGPSASMYGWKVSVINRTPNDAPVSAVATNVGSGTDPNLSTQTRPVLSWRTATAGRGYRGRLYLFSPQTADISTLAAPVAGMITAAANLGSDLLGYTGTAGTTVKLCIAHRHKGPPVTWTTTLVTSAVSRAKFGTIRKSGQYGKPNVGPW